MLGRISKEVWQCEEYGPNGKKYIAVLDEIEKED